MTNIFLSKFILISCFLLKFMSFTLFCHAICSIPQGQLLKDGQTLISEDGAFTFGFFSPPNSSLRYVGIWYTNVSFDSIVWVANRLAPIYSKNGYLKIEYNGELLVFDGVGNNVWSSNTKSCSIFHNGVLHYDGNFEIVGFDNVIGSNVTCWQSFDNPTDTYLSGAKALVNPNVGETHNLYSWKSLSDPTPGSYSLGVDPRASPQFVIWEGSKRRWRSGHWDGIIFMGVPDMPAFYNRGFKLSNMDALGNMYFTYVPLNLSKPFKMRLSWDGYEQALVWFQGMKEWTVFQSAPSSECDVYNKCGVNGYCSEEAQPICDCIEGFKPRDDDEWWKGNWSGGCVRKTQLQCEGNHGNLMDKGGFLEVDNVKLPDFADLLNNLDEKGCENQCLMNCSCMAHTYVSTIGCMTWSGDLFDIQQFPKGGRKLHIRLASSDIVKITGMGGFKIAVIILSCVILLCIFLLGLQIGSKLKVWNTKREINDGMRVGLREGHQTSTQMSGSPEILGENAPDVLFFDYNLVASATNLFSDTNKLGQGGFGPVYKGLLPGGQEIAVKKLSIKSGQEMEEFKNKIMLIAQLQHRNLVRILGFSMLGEEKILVYEYMLNKSLDCFIFDPVKRKQLDWRKQFTIIEGIARGLLYLHQNEICRTIHRDIKPSNILLDQEMNPKISDFGMAKIFGEDKDQAAVDRVFGTDGYMSPEYTMEGFFSEKSDVYSFGVLVIEIITGYRNSSFQLGEHANLIEYAWQLWNEGRTNELIDSSIGNSFSSNEITRRVHIAMLCVQDSAVYRPTMSQAVLWLETDTLVLPDPAKPTLTYSTSRLFIDMDFNKGVRDCDSSNSKEIIQHIAR